LANCSSAPRRQPTTGTNALKSSRSLAFTGAVSLAPDVPDLLQPPVMAPIALFCQGFIDLARDVLVLRCLCNAKERILDYTKIRKRFLAISAAALLGACAGTATSESKGGSLSDSAITSKVKTALQRDRNVSASAISVETLKGTVQLSGFADSPRARARAVALARAISGVKAVSNDIRLT
jgi:hypothetical protein